MTLIIMYTVNVLLLLCYNLPLVMAGEKYRLLNFGVLFRISIIMTREMKIVNAFLSLPVIFGYM